MHRLIGFLIPGRHRRLRDLLSAYVDGEVAESDRRRVEAHLESCDACRTELEELRATVSLLRRMPELAVPRSFALTPEHAVAQRPVMPGGWTLRLAASGAALILVGLIAADLLGAGIEQLPSTAVLERASTVEVEQEVVKEVPVERQAIQEAAAEVEMAVEAEKIVTVEAAAEVETVVEVVREVEKIQAVEVERLVVATPTPADEQVARLQAAPESEAAVEMAIATDAAAPTAAVGAPEEELAIAAAGAETPSPTPRPEPSPTAPAPPTEPTPVPTEPVVERVVVAPSPVQELRETDGPTLASPADDQGTISRRTWPVRRLEIAAAALLAVLIALTVWTRRRRV